MDLEQEVMVSKEMGLGEKERGDRASEALVAAFRRVRLVTESWPSRPDREPGSRGKNMI